ncbi:MAG TPA: Fis family transcriptional regulator [Lutibacter sp.]|nr:Fis family transcriptional regulator [Lutibacter sp.]
MDNTNIETNYNEGISHPGIVSKISKDSVEIAILGNVHCDACNAKSACGVSETETKIVEVPNIDNSFEINQQVEIVMQNSLGLKAVFYGYVLPFILLFVVLFVSSIYLKEWQAGLLALFVLLPYYSILYFNEKTLKKTFSISVLK